MAQTSNITLIAIAVISLNVLMWFTQLAMTDMNPAGSKHWNCTGTVIENFGSCSDYSINDGSEYMPSAEDSISPTTGNIFTDTFSSISRWVHQKWDFIMGIITAPTNILKSMNLPPAFIFGVGLMWYGFSLLSVILLFWGKE